MDQLFKDQLERLREQARPAGSLGMVSHKVALTEAGQADDELRGWLRQAYEQA